MPGLQDVRENQGPVKSVQGSDRQRDEMAESERKPQILNGEIMPVEAQRALRAVDYNTIRRLCTELGLKFAETDDCIKILKE